MTSSHSTHNIELKLGFMDKCGLDLTFEWYTYISTNISYHTLSKDSGFVILIWSQIYSTNIMFDYILDIIT